MAGFTGFRDDSMKLSDRRLPGANRACPNLSQAECAQRLDLLDAGCRKLRILLDERNALRAHAALLRLLAEVGSDRRIRAPLPVASSAHHGQAAHMVAGNADQLLGGRESPGAGHLLPKARKRPFNQPDQRRTG